jgi:hypothetical protein
MTKKAQADLVAAVDAAGVAAALSDFNAGCKAFLADNTAFDAKYSELLTGNIPAELASAEQAFTDSLTAFFEAIPDKTASYENDEAVIKASAELADFVTSMTE